MMQLPKDFSAAEFARHLSSIELACKSLSSEDLEELWLRGYIPTGVKDYLIAIRVNI